MRLSISNFSLILSLIFLLLVSEVSSNQNCTQQCSTMQAFSCSICVNTCRQQSTQSNPTQPATYITQLFFQNCKQETCTKWSQKSYDQKGNQKPITCLEYEWEILTEGQCTQQCCDNPSYHTFTASTFSQCLNANQSIQNLDKLIEISVGTLFGFLVLSCLLVCLFWRKIPCLKRAFDREQNSGGVDDNIGKDLSNAPEISIGTMTWIKTESNINQTEGQICAICLDSSMNCQTSCGHKFHLKCLKNWINKHANCPCCKSQKFNDMKVYCEKCQHLKVTITLLPRSLITTTQNDKIYCSQCIKKESLDSTSTQLSIVQ